MRQFPADYADFSRITQIKCTQILQITQIDKRSTR